jgi:hypothetical protein
VAEQPTPLEVIAIDHLPSLVPRFVLAFAPSVFVNERERERARMLLATKLTMTRFLFRPTPPQREQQGVW